MPECGVMIALMHGEMHATCKALAHAWSLHSTIGSLCTFTSCIPAACGVHKALIAEANSSMHHSDKTGMFSMHACMPAECGVQDVMTVGMGQAAIS